MLEKEASFINKKHIIRVYAIFGLLFCIFLMLSPLSTHFFYLGRGLFWLFGLTGYWLLLPLLIVGFIFSIHDASFARPFSFRLVVGVILFLLGASSLWCHVALKGGEVNSFSNFETLFEAMEPADYYLFNRLGGGLIGYFLAAVCNFGNGGFVYLVSILLLVSGLLIVFYPLLKKGWRLFRSHLAIANSRRKVLKQEEENARKIKKQTEMEEENKPLNGEFGIDNNEGSKPLNDTLSSPSFIPSPKDESFISKAPKIVMEHEEKANGSRLDLYGESPEISALPKDLTDESTREMASSMPASFLYMSGLHEAQFTVGKVNQQVETPSPSIKEVSVPLFMDEKKEAPTPETIPNSLTDETIAPSLNPTPTMEPAKEAPSPVISTPLEKEVSSLVTAPVISSSSLEESISLVPPEPKKEEKAPEMVVEAQPEETPVSFPNGQPKASVRPPYTFPSIDMLKEYPDTGNKKKLQQECEERKNIINQIFTDFNAGAHVDSYTVGPSVTRFNIKVDGGVTVSSINRYIQNISVRLGGLPTRYEEIVLGQATSGLEIANKVSTIVSLKDTIKNLPPLTPKSNLYVPFGESISGKFVYGDLSEFPHMLISGTTGSGKSIFMHGIIMSLIMRNRPEDLKLVMVDPKRVEMAAYRDLPHLLCPIIKEPLQAKVAFEKLIAEMERRYSVFEYSGVRDIRSFNNDYAPSAGVEKMPFIVVIIDEFADLADSCKNIDELVVRIAQKARAAGIHLIVATQRPSVDVISGTVKANLACRVALSAASFQDSMTILNQGGAEELAGHGDMLVSCSSLSRNSLVRCQGCLVDHSELTSVTSFIRQQIPVHYNSAFLDLTDHEAEEKASESAGPSKAEIRSAEGQNLYELIKETVMGREYTSISRIQREFGVGFPRAGKIMAQLQREGIVADEPDTASSSKGCRVLLHKAPTNDGNPGSTDQSGSTGGSPI